MRKTIFNLNHLIRIDIFDKQHCYYIQYKPFKKSFWGDTKEGFYSHDYISSTPYTKEELEKGKFNDIELLVKDNIAYFKPKVKLTFTNDIIRTREFNTYEEALDWGNELKMISAFERKTQLIIEGSSYIIH